MLLVGSETKEGRGQCGEEARAVGGEVQVAFRERMLFPRQFCVLVRQLAANSSATVMICFIRDLYSANICLCLCHCHRNPRPTSVTHPDAVWQ